MTLASPSSTPNEAVSAFEERPPSTRVRSVPRAAAAVYPTAYGDCEVDVEHLFERRAVMVRMVGYLPASETPAFVTGLLGAVARWRPIGIILDSGRLKTLSDATQLEIQTRLFPRIAELGVRRTAGITPETFLASRSFIEMIEEAPFRTPPIAGGELELAMFGTLEECFTWVEELSAKRQAAAPA